MKRFHRKQEAHRSATIEENRKLAKEKVRAAARFHCESLEKRLLFNAGGGWSGTGITGQYFANGTNTAPASFTRTDNRIDFTSGSELPGGSNDTAFAAVGAGGAEWSATWTGTLLPKFSESYTFKGYIGSSDSYSMSIGTSTGSETQLLGGGTNSANISLTTGTTYYVTVKFAETAANQPWQMQLHWLSTNQTITAPGYFAEEAIEAATPVGTTMEPQYPIMANAFLTGYYQNTAGTGEPTKDDNGWPTEDFNTPGIGNYGPGSEQAGTYLLTFDGQAAVTFYGNNATFIAGGTTYTTNTLPSGAGFTTASLIVPNYGGEQAGFELLFRNTIRNASDGGNGATNTGLTNLSLMRPTTEGSSTPLSTGTVISPAGISLASDFTTLRLMDWLDTNANTGANWSSRTLPSPTGSPAYASNAAGWPWEYAVELANETGKDLWINIPTEATDAYITDLANLLKNGSDGVMPFDSPSTTYTSSTGSSTAVSPFTSSSLNTKYQWLGTEFSATTGATVTQLGAYLTPAENYASTANGATATAYDSTGGNTAANAIDASSSTYWESAGVSSSEYLEIDLPAVETIGSTNIAWANNDYPAGYTLEVLNPSGTEWMNVFTTTAGGTASDSIGNVEARGMDFRIVPLANSSLTANTASLGTLSSSGATGDYGDEFTVTDSAGIVLNELGAYDPSGVTTGTHTISVINSSGTVVASGSVTFTSSTDGGNAYSPVAVKSQLFIACGKPSEFLEPAD
jgi:hypothetical protein